jgi:sec-independent protein translocase protein TatA
MYMLSNIIVGVIGPTEVILIVVVVVLLFGGKKIPELMKGLGKGIREFKEGMQGDQNPPKNNSTEEKKEK